MKLFETKMVENFNDMLFRFFIERIKEKRYITCIITCDMTYYK